MFSPDRQVGGIPRQATRFNLGTLVLVQGKDPSHSKLLSGEPNSYVLVIVSGCGFRIDSNCRENVPLLFQYLLRAARTAL